MRRWVTYLAAVAVVAAAVAPAAAGGQLKVERPTGDPVPFVIEHKAAQAGSTRAVLFHKKNIYRGSTSNFTSFKLTDPRIRISRSGKQLFAEVVPEYPGAPHYDDAPQPAFGYPGSFAVRDLDGDGEPEVMLELDWGGTHCCYWSRIYRFDASRGTYIPLNHWWGNSSATPFLQDLNKNGRPEFLSQDDRFTGQFTHPPDSAAPIQLWSYDHGAFRDVTRSYPRRMASGSPRLLGTRSSTSRP